MPLLVGVGQPTTPVIRVSDLARATWLAPDGTSWLLTDPELGWWTGPDVAGLDAAPIEMVTDPHPRGGTRVRHIQPGPRLITWPIHVYGKPHSAFLQRWRNLGKAFTQTRRLGPGTLTITRPDGSSRSIDAYYQSGWAGQPGQGLWWDTAVPTLYCEDPYWRDEVPTVISREYSAGPADFFDPFMTLTSSETLGETVLVNDGDVEAWPTWTITGPATEVEATNDTTGETFTLTPGLTGGGALLAGEAITITTNPPSVRGPAGENYVGALNWPGATLWSLVPGDNEVSFVVTGAAAGTRIELSFHKRYETA